MAAALLSSLDVPERPKSIFNSKLTAVCSWAGIDPHTDLRKTYGTQIIRKYFLLQLHWDGGSGSTVRLQSVFQCWSQQHHDEVMKEGGRGTMRAWTVTSVELSYASDPGH